MRLFLSRLAESMWYMTKELSLCHKLKYSNPYIYWTWCCRLLIFQTKIIWCNKVHILKYLRSTTMGCRDIGIIKLEFVSKTQLLCLIMNSWNTNHCLFENYDSFHIINWFKWYRRESGFSVPKCLTTVVEI